MIRKDREALDVRSKVKNYAVGLRLTPHGFSIFFPFSLFGKGSRRQQERIDHLYTIELLVMLQAFCEEIPTVRHLSSRDDQSIPPGQLIAILYVPRPFNDTSIIRNGMSGEKRPNIIPGTF